LNKEDYEIVLETNGTKYDREIFDSVDCVSIDMKSPSSKEESDEKILEKLSAKDQVKLVVADEKDYVFAKEIRKKTSNVIILQPADGFDTKWLVGKVLAEKSDFRIIPQIHKILEVA
jgi:7-carboxy-7-deazaguanine synthase